MKQEEVGFLVEYLASTSDSDQVIEGLDVLLSLCARGSANKMIKRLSGKTACLVSHKGLDKVEIDFLKLCMISETVRILDSCYTPWRRVQEFYLSDI